MGGASFRAGTFPALVLELPVHEGHRTPTQAFQKMPAPVRQLRCAPDPVRRSELVWPGAINPPVFVREGPATEAHLVGITPMLRAMTLPRGPRQGVLGGLASGAARPVGRSARDVAMAQRGSSLNWSGDGLPQVVLGDASMTDANLRTAAWGRGGTLAVQRAVRTTDAVPRFSTVSFEPQEAPFGYSGFKIQSGMPALPVSQAATPKAAQQRVPGGKRIKQNKPAEPSPNTIVLEDRFDAGLGNWSAGSADWKVDAAGVRPGTLALFQPSVGMTDYDLEFLVRIDQKSLSWVFRAADEQNYHLATIANSPQGRTFTRSSVIEDAPGLSVTTPVRQQAGTNSRAAVTVLTRVRGNDFTVSMDGEVIERWSDNRLTAGGVGFTGGPEQRARLYWIRLTAGASDR
jgi:hypothetical protein